jgi:hypothetical protein
VRHLFLPFPLLFLSEVTAGDASANSPDHSMMSGVMTGDGPRGASGQAADRMGGGRRQCAEGGDGDERSFDFHGLSLKTNGGRERMGAKLRSDSLWRAGMLALPGAHGRFVVGGFRHDCPSYPNCFLPRPLLYVETIPQFKKT